MLNKPQLLRRLLALCGLLLADADYFSIGTVDAQQLEEYADRRGMEVGEVKKIIPNNV